VSTPLYLDRLGQRVFAGVLVLSVDIDNFDFLAASNQPAHDRFAVLVDARDAGRGARITLHPYFSEVGPIDPNDSTGPEINALIDRDLLRGLTLDWRQAYHDPLGQAPGGTAYKGLWIAAAQPIRLLGDSVDPTAPERGPGGLVVLVQERSGAATAPVEQLGSRLVLEGVLALLAIGLTVAALWYFALRGRWPRPDRADEHVPLTATGPRPLRDRSTLSETGRSRG
jgi:hypothetical protein